jgi:streptogramin lyase
MRLALCWTTLSLIATGCGGAAGEMSQGDASIPDAMTSPDALVAQGLASPDGRATGEASANSAADATVDAEPGGGDASMRDVIEESALADVGESVDVREAGADTGSDDICGNGDTRACVPYPYQPAIPDETHCIDGGVCTSPCKNGTQTCVVPEAGIAHYGVCQGAVGPAQYDTCDPGNDNNCDGIANERCTCLNGQVTTCKAAFGALGPCAAGTATCTLGGWGSCSIQPAASDQCSVPGDDSNCDGFVHDTCACTPGQTGTCGAVLEAKGTCANGVATCDGLGDGWTCSILPAAADTCVPGNDDNCDGAANEGCACIDGSTCADGSTCVQGACNPLVVTAFAFGAADELPVEGIVASIQDSVVTDTAADLTATIHWGLGTSSGTITGGQGAFVVSGSFTYNAMGSITDTVTVTRNATGLASSGSATVTIDQGVVNAVFTESFGAAPGFITSGPDDAVWFTEPVADEVQRVSTTTDLPHLSVQSPFPTPSGSSPTGITAGPDGNVWLTENASGKVGRMTTAGVLTEFALRSAQSQPEAIVTGPDGNLWYVEQGTTSIGKMTPSGQATDFAVPTVGATLHGIAVGSDGNLWFTEDQKIGRVSTAGTFAEYTIPTSNSGPAGIAAGPDGALWFTEQAANKIGRITTTGQISEVGVPTAASGPTLIALGPSDGNLWFAEKQAQNVVRLSPPGMFSEYPVGISATGVASGPDGNVWYAGTTDVGRLIP